MFVVRALPPRAKALVLYAHLYIASLEHIVLTRCWQGADIQHAADTCLFLCSPEFLEFAYI